MSLHYWFLRLQSFLPHISRRLQLQLQLFTPLLEPAFQEDRYAQLLTLFCLDSASREKIVAARRYLDRLVPLCKQGGDAEKALWHALNGLCYMQSGDDDAMAAAFDRAAQYGHSYHLPYMLTAEYALLTSQQYDTALADFDRAISCIYQFPPLDEQKQYVIAQAQAGISLSLTMMHRQDEAARALQKAELAGDAEEYLHAAAMLYACQGKAAEAQKALDAFRKLNPPLADRTETHVRLLLAGKHIHFHARPVPPGLPEAFWDWFRSQEPVFQPLLDQGDADACGAMLADHINTLVPDEEDMMTAAIELHDNQPEIVLTACYSHSYAAMIDALAAACPEDLRSRWRITVRP